MFENTNFSPGNRVRRKSFSYEGEEFGYEEHHYQIGEIYDVVDILNPEHEMFPVVLSAPRYYDLNFHPDMLEKVGDIRKRSEQCSNQDN